MCCSKASNQIHEYAISFYCSGKVSSYSCEYGVIELVRLYTCLLFKVMSEIRSIRRTRMFHALNLRPASPHLALVQR
jgi:hypothetical protein